MRVRSIPEAVRLPCPEAQYNRPRPGASRSRYGRYDTVVCAGRVGILLGVGDSIDTNPSNSGTYDGPYMSSDNNDEYQAIENLKTSLNNVVPEPGTVSLLGLAVLALVRRR